MLWGDRDTGNAAELRLAAAVAEIEGLHTALLRTTDPDRRRRILAQLSTAARRLADLAGTAPGLIPAQARFVSRRQRRRAAIGRGAQWLLRATRDR
ncbi:hypothetical protein [Kitasatospora mediocidica]|uniref:hypothetical protein n=1 Tax=Kitasatospora mediocidica TaxID=58352 RepID=UPI00068C040E|nr:hypothetical protein [Kitasatospora mediocidica]